MVCMNLLYFFTLIYIYALAYMFIQIFFSLYPFIATCNLMLNYFHRTEQTRSSLPSRRWLVCVFKFDRRGWGGGFL